MVTEGGDFTHLIVPHVVSKRKSLHPMLLMMMMISHLNWTTLRHFIH